MLLKVFLMLNSGILRYWKNKHFKISNLKNQISNKLQITIVQFSKPVWYFIIWNLLFICYLGFAICYLKSIFWHWQMLLPRVIFHHVFGPQDSMPSSMEILLFPCAASLQDVCRLANIVRQH